MGYAVKLSSGGFTKITCTDWSVVSTYSSTSISLPANVYGVFICWAGSSNTSYYSFGFSPSSGVILIGSGSGRASSNWAPTNGRLYFAPCLSTASSMSIYGSTYCSVGCGRAILNLE